MCSPGIPTGTGTGGPGYTVPDRPAHGGQEQLPRGNGRNGQWRDRICRAASAVVYKGTTLPPNYTIWGEVTEGLDTVTAIADKAAKAGVTDGAPADTVTIETATAN